MPSWAHPYPTTIRLDGHALPVEVARLSNTEAAALRFGLARGTLPRRGVPQRKPGEDATVGETGAFVLSDDEIHMLRLFESAPAELEAYITNVERAAQAYAQTCHHAITTYVRLPQPWTHPDEAVTVAGIADLLEAYGSREDVIAQLIVAIRRENEVGPVLKNALSSLAASVRGSVSEDPATTGAPPAGAAASAASSGSVAPAGVTASPASV